MNDNRGLSPLEVAAILRKRIRDGEFTEDGRLPSQGKLAEELGVSRGAVRQAQQALQDEGLLNRTGKGSVARVAEPPVADKVPQPTLVALAHRLEAAFLAPRVHIDAVCLTAETLMNSMDAPLRLVELQQAKPGSVTARIILPAREHRLLYPAPLQGWGREEAVDAAVHERSERQFDAQVKVLRRHFDRLRIRYGINAEVRFRIVHNSPYQKFYLLNRTEVLFAHYKMTERTEEIRGTETPLRDTSGTQPLLFPFDGRHGERDSLLVRDTQEWFDAFWDGLGPDLMDTSATSR
ncbi:GntR family transcriptional regulator [Streptomyces sp. NPDC001848]|uniref:GntR family transcriptional regulator n=1 Tax=Streptomyces sp. NPDC001848 TaxID=3364618 RepID=UPI0036CADB33